MDKTNDQILTLRKGGMSLRGIAKEVGLSHVAVKKRLDKMTSVNPPVNDMVVVPEDTSLYLPTQDMGGKPERRFEISLYPDLDQAILELDEGLKAVELIIREELKVAEDTGFVIHLDGGWKIEKNSLVNWE
ncbi:MAG: hypothetical protein Q7J31_15650 [Syntrophales bacterium]|uniref:hypothetical protein n=1 Tax=Candidatus Wunengus sp. YC61 TaxID=3367698 RepID=UPI002728A2A6|nr:hypothetical protein [Syntrophales bacterium]